MDEDLSYIAEHNLDLPPWISAPLNNNFDLEDYGDNVGALTPLSFTDMQEPSRVLSEPDVIFDAIPVSTAFHAGVIPQPNTLLTSSDGVLFYVHEETILHQCPRAFEGEHQGPFGQQIIQLDAPSAELNIILHALYGTAVAAHSPDTNTLINAIDRMSTYFIPPESVIRPSTELHSLLFAHAFFHPLEIYALAARYDLSSLAISVSSCLLSYDLTTIPDHMAERMGAFYLKKLVVLHLKRRKLLKQILLRPPCPHGPTDECGFKQQDKLMRTWAMLSAYFAWDRHADLSPSRIQSVLESFKDLEKLTCKSCTKVLGDKIKDAIIRWASVERTI